MKKCTKCNIEKDLGCFSKHKGHKDGMCSNCKDCVRTYQNIFYKSDVGKKYTNYYLKVYKEDNKDRIKNYMKTYNEYHREERNKGESIKKKDPMYKLKCDMRSVLNNSLRKRGFHKKSKSEIIIGCSFSEFKLYLESKFEFWMNWDNKGKYNGELNYGWDVDHITPLSSAKTEDEIIKLNHYTNLQPLCSKVNRDIKRDIEICLFS